jgi:hypothetical protein
MGGIPRPTEFRLSPVGQDSGISCDSRGAYVGSVPLLKRQRGPNGQDFWSPRPMAELNTELSVRYGVPVDFAGKAGGLSEITTALNRGDVFRAQLATQQLKLPDPPPAAGGLPGDSMRLATQLGSSGVLAGSWDETKHPRWQAGDAQGRGGEFSPSNSDGQGSGVAGRVIQAQEVLPIPLETPFDFPLDTPWEIPWRAPQPGDYGPIPLNAPNGLPRNRPFVNPRPDDPDCVEQWAHALSYCTRLRSEGKLKKGGAFGANLEKCVLGMISEKCGGNPNEPSKGIRA